MNPQLADLPTGVLVAIVIAGLLQVTLDVIAFVDLYRRPVERVTLGNKWVWVAIILFVNLLGAILYLAVGRRPAPAAEVPQAPWPTRARAEGVVESLYGRRDEGDDPR
jgi:Phospholipase_D-nuclease N-terminal